MFGMGGIFVEVLRDVAFYLAPLTYEEATGANARMTTMERLVVIQQSMTDEERDQLQEWERDHVTGDGRHATSDWPGWDEMIKRYGH